MKRLQLLPAALTIAALLAGCGDPMRQNTAALAAGDTLANPSTTVAPGDSAPVSAPSAGTSTAHTSVRSDGGIVTAHSDAGRLVLDEASPADGYRVGERSVGDAAIVVTFIMNNTSSVEVTVTLTNGRLSTAVRSHTSTVTTSDGA